MQSHDYMAFTGSVHALKFAVRDLETVQQAMALVTRRALVVQAGGCLGVYPAYLSKYFDAVVTFEGLKSNFQKMRENITAENVTMRLAALGAEAGTVGLRQQRRTKTFAPAHEGIAHVFGAGKTPVVRVDDLELSACDFLCLDLEGYELPALRGAERTIATHRPVLMVEINGNCRHYGIEEADVRQWIGKQGYRFVFRKHADEVYVPQERA